jgi:hypothetical protein
MAEEELYLPEELAEWVALKKSEYLSRLIMGQRPGDFGFEEFSRFDHLIPQTLQWPDRTHSLMVEGQEIRFMLRTYLEAESFHQLVIGAIYKDRPDSEAFIPILTVVTRFPETLQTLLEGEPQRKPTLN